MSTSTALVIELPQLAAIATIQRVLFPRLDAQMKENHRQFLEALMDTNASVSSTPAL